MTYAHNIYDSTKIIGRSEHGSHFVLWTSGTRHTATSAVPGVLVSTTVQSTLARGVPEVSLGMKPAYYRIPSRRLGHHHLVTQPCYMLQTNWHAVNDLL